MTITSNRYLLAIAMTILSCISTVVANNSSMKEDLIKVYEEEEQRLIKETKRWTQIAEKEGWDLQDDCGEYHDSVDFPLHICQKYLSILKNPITRGTISSLEDDYEKWGKYDVMLAVKYLSSILAAIYFDRRDEKKNSIDQAMAIMYDQQPAMEMTQRERAINFYIRAKICKQLSVDNPDSEVYYTEFFNNGIYENDPLDNDTPSVVLSSLFDELKNCSFS